MRRFALCAITVCLVIAVRREALGQSHDARVGAMLRAAADDIQADDFAGADARVQLSLRTCAHDRCSPAIVARVHVVLAVIAAGRNDADTATREFTTALGLDHNARPDGALITPTVRAAFLRARNAGATEDADTSTPSNGATRGANSVDTESPEAVQPSPANGCHTNADCASGQTCTAGSCAASESEPESHAAATPSATWTYSFEIGGGAGAAWLSPGMPEYEEFREWDSFGSGNFTCGPPSMPLSCPMVANGGFALEAFVSLAFRFNVADRVGIELFVQFQPDAASVGILPSLFFGGRVLVALTHDGYVRHGFVPSVFLGTGVGQMEATPPVPAGVPPAAHIISGLNNVNAGGRIEYGVGIVHFGAELSFNLQIPNVLFVIDALAFAGVHF